MPPGDVAAENLPDFIAVADSADGQAGYAAKRDLLDATGHPQPINHPINVYGDDLHTVVGHLYPGRGFVALGTDPAAVPTIPVTVAGASIDPALPVARIVLYVRNQTSDTRWLATLAGGEILESLGYPTGLGSACLVPAPDLALVTLSAPPQDGNSAVTQNLGQIGRRAVLWLDIGQTGLATSGAGIPPWWPGDPQGC